MNKLLSFFFILSILMTQSNIFSKSAANYLYKNEWDFLEDKLMNSDQTSSKSKVIHALIASLIGFGVYSKSNNYLENHNYDHPYDEYSPESIATINLSSASLSSITTFCILQYILRHKNYRQNFRNFIAVWPENKKFTPKALREAFDIAHDNYKKSPTNFFAEEDKLLKLTLKQIEEHIPDRYKKSKIKKYLIPKIFTNSFNLCIGKIAKWTTQIIWAL